MTGDTSLYELMDRRYGWFTTAPADGDVDVHGADGYIVARLPEAEAEQLITWRAEDIRRIVADVVNLAWKAD